MNLHLGWQRILGLPYINDDLTPYPEHGLVMTKEHNSLGLNTNLFQAGGIGTVANLDLHQNILSTQSRSRKDGRKA